MRALPVVLVVGLALFCLSGCAKQDTVDLGKQIDDQMTSWDQKIVQVKADVAKAPADLKLKLEPMILALEGVRDGIHKQITDSKTMTGKAQEVAQGKIQEAIGEMKKAYNKVADELKKKP